MQPMWNCSTKTRGLLSLTVLVAAACIPAFASAAVHGAPAIFQTVTLGDARVADARPASAPVAFAADGSPRLAIVDTARRTARATVVDFHVARSRTMRLEVRDLDGNLVRTIAEGRWAEGRHRLAWQHDSDAGAAVADGLYLVQLVGSPEPDPRDTSALAR